MITGVLGTHRHGAVGTVCAAVRILPQRVRVGAKGAGLGAYVGKALGMALLLVACWN